MSFASPGGAEILVLQTIILAIATAAITARLYLRLKIQSRSLLGSDFIMCGAWVVAMVQAALVIAMAALGSLTPELQISFENWPGSLVDLTTLLKLVWVSNFTFYATSYLCKGALLAVYLQVFPVFMVKRRIFLWATIVYVVAGFIVTVALVLGLCPPESNWSLDPNTRCPPRAWMLSFQVGFALDFSGDILTFILPWFIIPGLNIRWSLQLGVYVTFLLGLISIIFCLLCFITLQQALVDYNTSFTTVVLWNILDIDVALVVAILPSLRPFFNSTKSPDPSSGRGASDASSGQPSGVATIGSGRNIDRSIEAIAPWTVLDDLESHSHDHAAGYSRPDTGTTDGHSRGGGTSIGSERRLV
ncbi:hypothetical protein NM208_g4560 [Fusarium decemcellulare]|uniref:Uncharacterized protein n=1 Tax=Fusarium decemcellulare TaxID=57161 RepID=A0ACC1SKC1_9HYPO|nr:hypothetical protein NM208_g4560 [Fusarium decemcellulare]